MAKKFNLLATVKAAEARSAAAAESVVEAFSQRRDDPLHPGKRNFLMEVKLTVVVTNDVTVMGSEELARYVEKQFRSVFQLENFSMLELTPIPKEFN